MDDDLKERLDRIIEAARYLAARGGAEEGYTPIALNTCMTAAAIAVTVYEEQPND